VVAFEVLGRRGGGVEGIERLVASVCLLRS
jgi:hypothetical protein